MTNADWLKEKPIAHRGLHDGNKKCWENSLSAVKAAIDAGYGIEVDLHPSSDHIAMVFHDAKLERLTGQSGNFRDHTAADLKKIAIGGTKDTIPSLRQLLNLVDGKTGLVLELKGIAGTDEGFVAAVLEELETYQGNVAIMSFNHWLLADARALMDRFGINIPLGLTAEGDDTLYETHMQAVSNYAPDFISYHVDALPNRFITEFHATGKPVITWTVRNQSQKRLSDKYADQITFEGFLP